MKRENLEKANEIDWSIREIETAIEKYNSNLADEVPLPIPGISRTSLSIPASRDVIKIIIDYLVSRIINMMIVIPMIIQNLSFGYVLKYFLNNDPRNAISFAGFLLILATLFTLNIKTKTIIKSEA